MDPLVLGLAEHQISVVSDPARADDVGLAIANAARASAGGTLIVYFAGHGLPDENSDLYLALTDTRRDELPWKALPFRHLRSAIRRSLAAHRVLILDCCFSGLSNSEAMTGNDPVVDGSGIGGAWTLYSSSDSEASLAPKGERNTAFTGELLEVLRGGIPGRPDELVGDAILAEVSRRLHDKGRPTPGQHGSGFGSKLAIARNRAPMGTHKDRTAADVLDPERQATMLSFRVQWPDEQVCLEDHLREDERCWVLYVKNSGAMPAHDVWVYVSLPGYPDTRPIDFGAVVDGEPRCVYILRPWDGYTFDPNGDPPDVEATFTMGGSRWHSRAGVVRPVAPGPGQAKPGRSRQRGRSSAKRNHIARP
jgi:hypothetical protein